MRSKPAVNATRAAGIAPRNQHTAVRKPRRRVRAALDGQLACSLARAGTRIDQFDQAWQLQAGLTARNQYFAARQSRHTVVGTTDLPAAERPRYEYLTGASFDAYVHARANRQDAFYIRPAGGVDVCNVNVPIRAVRDAAK